MKRKGSMLRAIVLRFIGFSLGTELAISVLEELISALAGGAERIFLYDRFPGEMAAGDIAWAVLWGAVQLAVYGAGVFLFARSISRLLKQQIREREEERMRLFSHIAHDLKTPMTTITGYAGALADGMVDGEEKQREYHQAIKAKSGQMNGLINQLLSYSKLGSAQYSMNVTRTDVAELLRAACASLFGEMENKRMDLELNLPEQAVFCEVDALELNRAASNLLTNAIRHNPVGTLLCVGLKEEGEHIAIQIADSGEAIPEAIAKKLFDPFVSGDISRSSGSGTGLGLAITKKVAEQHSGEVFVADASTPYTKMFVLKIKKGGSGNVPQSHKK